MTRPVVGPAPTQYAVSNPLLTARLGMVSALLELLITTGMLGAWIPGGTSPTGRISYLGWAWALCAAGVLCGAGTVGVLAEAEPARPRAMVIAAAPARIPATTAVRLNIS